jgi:hypothetical protein
MRGLSVLTAIVLLAACDTTPPPAPPQSAALAAAPAAAPSRTDARVTQVKLTTAEIPEWYVNPPRDDNAHYAAGTANSADLEFAVAKAILAAKRSLADRFGGSVSSQHKEFLQEVGGKAEPAVVSDRATTNRVTDVVLNGYSVVHTKLVATDTQYRAFVLLQFPLGNVVTTPAQKKPEPEAVQETKLRAAKAFDELQKDIDAAKRRNDVLTNGLVPPQ